MDQPTLPTPPVPLAAGMLSAAGRVLEVRGAQALVATEQGVAEVDVAGLELLLADDATYFLALAALGKRVGLNPVGGILWQLSDEDPLSGVRTWVLEDQAEVRTRDGDTDDPREALARALTETI